MKRMRLLVSLIVSFGLFNILTAQNSSISGTVKSSDGSPLAGASVVLDGTFIGTYSDSDGTYTIESVKKGNYSLIVTFMGYEKYSAMVTIEGDVVADIILYENTIMGSEVVVRGIRAGSRTPVAHTNLDTDYLKSANIGQDIPYILSLTPSLVETSEAGNGIGYTGFRIRGSDGSRINVTVDGVPLNDSESQQVFWVDLPDLASSVGNIQIQRGVGSSTNGSGAFGASVNIETESPAKEPFASITAGFGSFNTFRSSVTAGTGLLKDKFSLNLRHSTMTTDGYIDYSGSDHSSMHLTAVWASKTSRVKGSVLIGKERTGISWWGVPADMINVNRRYNPAGEYTDENGKLRYYEDETDNYNQNHYSIAWSEQITGDLLLNLTTHLTTGEGYYEQRKEDRSLADYGLPDIAGPSGIITESDLVERKWLDNMFGGLTWSLIYNPGILNMTFGGTVNNYSGDHFGRIIWLRHPGLIEKDHQWYLNNGSKQEYSSFLKSELQISGAISLYADLQYRKIDYLLTGQDDDLRDMDEELNYNFINPKAGLFYTMNDRNSLYASFSVANREPTRANIKDAAGDNRARPEHETLYDTELGYTMKGSGFTMNLNLYHMSYNNQLVPTGELSNVGYPIMTNVKESFRQGAELIAGVKLMEELEFQGSLTLSRNRIIDFVEYYTDYNTTDWSSQYLSKPARNVDIAFSPSILGSGELKYTPDEKLIVALSGKYVGEQYFDNTGSNERSLDPYFVSNLRVEVRPKVAFASKMSLQFMVNNIFNNLYISNGYGGNWYEDGIEKTWAYYFPQAGINYMINLNLEF